MNMTPIQIAVSWAGSKSKLAGRLGVTKSTISMWGDFVPEGRAYQIEVLSGGKVTAVSLGWPRPAEAA
ncbi:MAG: Cro/CI family transcriptional regulator [Ectothiorhodospiraceae bacterium]|nr:Cro/CI family transcriptional regulator [Ectothiorhodospiraceae bacterium]